MTRMTTCPTCGTYGYIPPASPALRVVPDAVESPRIVRLGETTDLAPHETVAVLDDQLGVLWTVNGGPTGVKGMRIG